MLRPKAVAVTPIPGHKLEVVFETGEKKLFDVTPYIKGSFYGELADEEYFKTVFIDELSVAWPHDQGICPDDLYLLSTPM